MIERAVCSWRSEDRRTAVARGEFFDSAAHHDAHGDDLTKCDSWLCVCGKTDSHGGSWETCDESGREVEPTGEWSGHQKCLVCGRVYDREGLAVVGPGTLSA